MNRNYKHKFFILLVFFLGIFFSRTTVVIAGPLDSFSVVIADNGSESGASEEESGLISPDSESCFYTDVLPAGLYVLPAGLSFVMGLQKGQYDGLTISPSQRIMVPIDAPDSKAGMQLGDTRVVYRYSGIDPNRICCDGKTNLERMDSGNPPYVYDLLKNDGSYCILELHHITQEESGPLIELARSYHQHYTRILHTSGHISFRTVKVLRQHYADFRPDHWKRRAQEFKELGF